MVKYPVYANELDKLLQDDQIEKKQLARSYFETDTSAPFEKQKATLRIRTQQRTKRMLEILSAIEEPSIYNIGTDAALSIAVLATHDGITTMQTVLQKFNTLYEKNPKDCRYQSIPALTDALLIAQKKPQSFGTQWFFDEARQPLLYPVEDFEHVNQRRMNYGIEPLRWPKSLAIPESEQPWLLRPLSELVMREPTEAEYELNHV